MDDDKRILVFSDAGGTGRSYHANLLSRNQRLRVHYLLEAGWKADTERTALSVAALAHTHWERVHWLARRPGMAAVRA